MDREKGEESVVNFQKICQKDCTFLSCMSGTQPELSNLLKVPSTGFQIDKVAFHIADKVTQVISLHKSSVGSYFFHLI